MDVAKIERVVLPLTRTALQQALDDWEVQVGFASRVTDGASRLARGPDGVSAFWNKEPHLEVTTQIEGAAAGPIKLYFSVESAWPLLREVLCLPGSADRGAAGLLGDEEVEAFMEMMNLLCGSANTVYDNYGLRFSQSVDHLRVVQNKPGLPSTLRGFLSVLPYEIAGGETREILQVLSFPLARAIANVAGRDVREAG